VTISPKTIALMSRAVSRALSSSAQLGAGRLRWMILTAAVAEEEIFSRARVAGFEEDEGV